MTRRSLEERETIAWSEYRNACPAYGDHSSEAVLIEKAAYARLKRELVFIKHARRQAGLEDALAAADTGPVP